MMPPPNPRAPIPEQTQQEGIPSLKEGLARAEAAFRARAQRLKELGVKSIPADPDLVSRK